jgi:hypothetical protein
MVVSHRLSARAPPSPIDPSYHPELFLRPIGCHDPGDVYIPSLTDHAIVGTLSAEQLRSKRSWVDS